MLLEYRGVVSLVQMAVYSALCFLLWIPLSTALPYLEDQVAYNLNTNQAAKNPLEYDGSWENHVYNPSPDNWRMPFYTVTLDRFVNGDPTNDEANGTHWEHDPTSNQFRFGGDIRGLQNTLDYIQGMGVKVCDFPAFPCLRDNSRAHTRDTNFV